MKWALYKSSDDTYDWDSVSNWNKPSVRNENRRGYDVKIEVFYSSYLTKLREYLANKCFLLNRFTPKENSYLANKRAWASERNDVHITSTYGVTTDMFTAHLITAKTDITLVSIVQLLRCSDSSKTVLQVLVQFRAIIKKIINNQALLYHPPMF